MKNKKFVSIASSLGLSVGLLAGCGTNTVDNQKDKDDNSHSSSIGGNGAGAVGAGAGIIGGNNSKSSKGVGTAKGGGATS